MTNSVIGPRRMYTEAEKKLIMASGPGEIAALAARLGRSSKAVRTHRNLMKRRGSIDVFYHVARGVPKNTTRYSRFARPAWFDEDLGLLLKMK